MWFIQAAGAFMNIVGLLKAFELPRKNAVVEGADPNHSAQSPKAWFKTEARCSKM